MQEGSAVMRSDTKNALTWAAICVIPVALIFGGLRLETGFHSLNVRVVGGLLALVGFVVFGLLMLRQHHADDMRDKITRLAEWVAIMIFLILPFVSQSQSAKLIGPLFGIAGFTTMMLRQFHLLPYQAAPHKARTIRA